MRTSVPAVVRSQRPSVSDRAVFRSAQRLRTPAEFAQVLAAAPKDSLRASAGRLSMKALVSRQHAAPAAVSGPSCANARVRLGITVGKRNARRAVDRVLIKRIVREAFRAARPGLEKALGAGSLDINVRLSAPLGLGRVAAAGGAGLIGATHLRRSVRDDADRLFEHLTGRLPAHAGAFDHAEPDHAEPDHAAPEHGASDRGESEPA